MSDQKPKSVKRKQAPKSKSAKPEAKETAAPKRGEAFRIKAPSFKKPSFKKPSIKGSGIKAPSFQAPAAFSNLKAPAFAEDLIHDLRERRLLPVVIVMVVAIVALPIVLMGGGGGESSDTGAVPVAEDLGSLPPEAQAVVASANDSLRDYRKRLSGDAATDPFVQKFAAPPPAEAGSAESGTLESVSPSGVESAAAAPSGATAGDSTPDAAASPEVAKSSTIKFVTWEISAWQGPAEGELKLRQRIGRLDFLPSEQNPAAVFLGVSDDGRKALFSVSNDALSVTGGGVCLNGTETSCSLMLLTPGKAMQIWFADGRSYAIKLARIERVVRDAP